MEILNRPVVCPFCFEKIELSKAHVRIDKAVYDGNGSIVGLDRSVEPPPAPPSGFWERMWAKFARQRRGGDLLRDYICPNPECGNVLPEYIEDARQIVVPIIGGFGAGKTFFVAGLVRSLFTPGSRSDLGITGLIPLGDTESLYERTYAQLFTTGEPPTASPRATPQSRPKPLIYQLMFGNSNNGKTSPIHLILFDVSGEDLEDRLAIGRYHRHLFEADGMIILVDPLKLEKYNANRSTMAGAAPDQVVERILQSYNRQLGRQPQTPFTQPVAVTLAKADVVATRLANQGSAGSTIMQVFSGVQSHGTLTQEEERFIREFSSMGSTGFRPELFWEMSDITRGMIDRLGGADLTYMIENRFESARVAYCGVTATCQEAQADGRFANPEPRHCLDPLYWILANNSVIPTPHR